jgi:hypothetical protein
MSWFQDDKVLCNEIEELQKELFLVRAELGGIKKEREKLQAELNSQKAWNDGVRFELEAANLRNQMYDRIMLGLRINVNLTGKTK